VTDPIGFCGCGMKRDYGTNGNNETNGIFKTFRLFRYFRLFRNPSSLLGVVLTILASVACDRSELARIKPDPQKSSEITVSAAASLQSAFREIGKLYESRTATRVNFNFAASGALERQIESGAPVDIFASAGRPQMDALATGGLIMPETRRDFARNTLVLVVPADRASSVTSFLDLGSAKMTRLAVGNPKTVPAGQYAQQSLTHLDLWPRLQPYFIMAEDVRQVLDYVARGEVDAGILYSSDVRTDENRVRIVASAPVDSHDPILYPLAVLRASRRQEAARAFAETVLSEEGQGILEKYGFKRVR
jgi:molybdate transport system substrate-binding protein